MKKRVQKTAKADKGAVEQTDKEHDALTVAAVTSYLEDILTKRPKRGPTPQSRTFNVRVTLGIGDTQRLAFYCRRANMTPGQWLAMKAKCAVYHLAETEQNYKEINAMVMEVIERTEPGRTVVITPKNAAMLKQVSDFFGDGETPDNLINEFSIGGYSNPLEFAELVISGLDRTPAEASALLEKAQAHFGEQRGEG